MDENTRYIIFGLGLPAAMGLAVGAAAARGARDAGAEAGPGRGVGALIVVMVLAVLAGALAISTYGVHGGVNIPPVSSDDRLRWVPGALWAVAVVGVLVRLAVGGRMTSAAHPPDRVIAVVASILAAAVGVAIVLGPTSLTSAKVIALPALAVWAGFACKFLARFHEQQMHVRAGVILVGLSAAVGAALLGTGSQFLGMYGFGAAAIALGVTAGALVLRGPTRPFTIAIIASFLATLLACGVYLSSTPWWVVAVLGAVVPISYLVTALSGGKKGSKAVAAMSIVVAAVIAIVAVAPGIKSLVDFMTGASQKEPMY